MATIGQYAQEQQVGQTTRPTVPMIIDEMIKQAEDVRNYARDVLGVKLMPVREQSPVKEANVQGLTPNQNNVMGQLAILSNTISSIRNDLSQIVGELQL